MGDEQWQVTGSAAEVYERELVPAIFGPWAPRVVALAAPATGERALDVACGTGVAAGGDGLAVDRPQPGVRGPGRGARPAHRAGGGRDHAGAVRPQRRDGPA